MDWRRSLECPRFNARGWAFPVFLLYALSVRSNLLNRQSFKHPTISQKEQKEYERHRMTFASLQFLEINTPLMIQVV